MHRLTDSSVKRLLAVDPGLMTGVSMVDVSDLDSPKVIWSGEWDIETFHTKIDELMKNEDGELGLVYENYIITDETSKKSQQPWSLHLIGVMNYFGWKYSVPITIQKPSDKQFASNERLKSVDFWHVGGAGHANDSLRHAMVWIVNKHRKFAVKLVL